MRAKIFRGFSLIEIMIVLLIVAVIAAASAPMVTKKLAGRNAGIGDSPWVFTGLNGNIAYNLTGNANTSAIIGARDVNRTNGQPIPKLYIESTGQEPQIGFGSRGQNGYASLLMDRINNRVAFTNAEIIPNNSVVFGTNQEFLGGSISFPRREVVAIGTGTVAHASSTALGFQAEARSPFAIAIGAGATAGENAGNTASPKSTIAIGRKATTSGLIPGIAIGDGTTAGHESITIGHTSSSNSMGIAIGSGTHADSASSTAVGSGATASAGNATAIGAGATASAQNATAIGSGATANTNNRIVLGTNMDTVEIPGNLVVQGNVQLATNGNARVQIRTAHGHTAQGGGDAYGYVVLSSDNLLMIGASSSNLTLSGLGSRLDNQASDISSLNGTIDSLTGRIQQLEYMYQRLYNSYNSTIK